MTREEVTIQLGLDATKMKPGAEQARSEIGRLTNSVESSFEKLTDPEKFTKKFMTRLLKPAMFFFVGAIKDGLHQAVEFFSNALAEVMFSNKALEARGRGLDEYRNSYRKANEERWKAEKETQEKIKREEKERIELLKKEDALIQASADLRFEEMGGKDSEKARQFKLQNLQTEKSLAEIALYQAQRSGDKLKIAEAETTLEKLKLSVLQAQNQEIDIQKKKRAEQMSQLDKFRGPLDAINAKLLQDLAMNRAYDNPATRMQLSFDLMQRQKLLGDITRQLQPQQKTTVQSMTDALLGQLVSSGAVQVKVVNAE